MYVFYVLQIFGNKVNLESICRFCDIKFEIIAKIAKKKITVYGIVKMIFYVALLEYE